MQRDNRNDNTIQGVLTRPLERWHRIRMSELDVRVRPFCPPARNSRVFLSLARSNCARKPDSNQLLPPPKKKEEQTTTAPQRLWFPHQPQLMARFDTWLHQTAELLQTVSFRPKTAHSVSHVTRETCFVNTSATLFALSTFCSRNRPVDTQD